MAIRISKDIYAKACDCDCGGEVDVFRDRGDNRWYAYCMQCGEIGPKATDWADAVNRYPKHARFPARYYAGAST